MKHPVPVVRLTLKPELKIHCKDLQRRLVSFFSLLGIVLVSVSLGFLLFLVLSV